MASYGQIVVGPPGAGKSTFCYGMQMFAQEIGRKAAIVNLDFANDNLLYNVAIDVRKFLTLQDVMEKYDLGPNGGLVFCMESLKANIDWLVNEIAALLPSEDEDITAETFPYFVFDCPGQVELYSHHSVVQDIIRVLSKRLDMRLCSVNILDSFYCSQPATFVSAALLVTSTMLRLELPHVNVLSKIDQLKQYGPLPFTLDFFTEMMDLSPMLRYLEGRVEPVEEIERREAIALESHRESKGESADNGDEDEDEDERHQQRQQQQLSLRRANNAREKHQALTAAICEVVDNYGLVSFLPLSIEDAELMGRVLAAIDRANGYNLVLEYEQMNEQHPTSVKQNKSLQKQRDDEEEEQQQRRTARAYYHYASDQLESASVLGLEIHEKYGHS